MNVERELGKDDMEARLVGRLAAAYTLLALAPFTVSLDFAPGDTAAYVVKQAKLQGKLYRLHQVMGTVDH